MDLFLHKDIYLAIAGVGTAALALRLWVVDAPGQRRRAILATIAAAIFISDAIAYIATGRPMTTSRLLASVEVLGIVSAILTGSFLVLGGVKTPNRLGRCVTSMFVYVATALIYWIAISGSDPDHLARLAMTWSSQPGTLRVLSIVFFAISSSVLGALLIAHRLGRLEDTSTGSWVIVQSAFGLYLAVYLGFHLL